MIYLKSLNPSITFGMIVLNGEPFIAYNLRSLYPFAHQIILVEGAAPAAASIANPDGHSSDTTVETIRRFQAEEDPENKVILVTAEDEGHRNGFWPGEKDEMSQAYAKRATGDYLWQVDSDEFYLESDMKKVIQRLQNDPEISAVSFKMVTFWGGFDYLVDGWYLQRGAQYYHRLFKWEPGYRYVTHRPPTVVDDKGRDLRTKKWIYGKTLEKEGIFLRHYSLLFPKQVKEKCAYYGNAEWARRQMAEKWVKENFLDLKQPFRVHNVYDYPSWLKRFTGQHPSQINQMRKDIKDKKLAVHMRKNTDVERLLRSPLYQLCRSIICFWNPFDLILRKFFSYLKFWIKRISGYSSQTGTF